jgi:hypothetical protein
MKRLVCYLFFKTDLASLPSRLELEVEATLQGCLTGRTLTANHTVPRAACAAPADCHPLEHERKSAPLDSARG